MLTRRQLALGTAAAALGSGMGMERAFAQSPKILKLGNASGFNDPQQCFLTAGRHPKLGFYASEGIDFEIMNISNVVQTLQAVATGEVTFGNLAPGVYLPAVAKEPILDLVAAYNWLPRNANTVVVKADSPLKTIADLKGKRIGIRNQGDTGVIIMRVMFRELGLDDSSLQFIAVGDSGPAGIALSEGRIDAVASYDTAAARIELAGFPVRYLPLTPEFAKVSVGWMGVKRAYLKENRKEVVSLFRGIAKSTLFAYTNTEQAIRIHWSLYPESRPKSRSEDEAVKEMLFLLRDRKENWMRRPSDPDQRMGASSAFDWSSQIAMSSESSKDPQLATKLGDPARLYTNELIDEVNAFDRAAVIRQAKEFKL